MAAGLLRDLGEMILQQLFPEAYQTVLEQPAEALIDGQCALEETHCSLDHAEVSEFILDRWRLRPTSPKRFTTTTIPTKGHFRPSRPRIAPISSTSPLGRHQLLLYPDQPMVLRGLLELAQRRYQMNEEDVHAFLIPLGKKTTEFAALLQVDIGDANDYQTVLRGPAMNSCT